ncbi:sepiapterin reductase-like [Antedon mediterranea]|uniref:sepiapterin reductase-like n=1 Tax=Antedon mediterranea TaxID=105859 RepID=UPI003AF7EBAC
MSKMNLSVFGVPTFCVITGASRGIGRSIAVNLSGKLDEESSMVITARNAQGLEETKRLIDSIATAVKVRVVAGDLGNSSALKTLINSIFEDVEPSKFKHAILINNAGTLGDVSKKMHEIHDDQQLQKYYFENITSAHMLTGNFITVFQKLPEIRKTVVQISSLAAIEPIPTWSMYCTAKAARDMLFSVLAKEEPTVRVLNYAPGPIDTQMLHTIIVNTQDENVRKMMKDVLEEGKTVKLEDTVAKLIKILDLDEFKSGSHIDYYD